MVNAPINKPPLGSMNHMPNMSGSTQVEVNPAHNPFPEVIGVKEGLMNRRLETLVTQGEYVTFMVAGQPGLGKSTLISNIFAKHISKETDVEANGSYIANMKKLMPGYEHKSTTHVKISDYRFPVEGVPFSVRLIDTPGFGDTFEVEKSFEQVVSAIQKEYDYALDNEFAVNRDITLQNKNVGVDAILYFMGPHRIKELDIAMIKKLGSMSTIIPILSKADTMTMPELKQFKTTVLERFAAEGITTFCEPYAIISSPYLVKSQVEESETVIGREYPWGTVEAERHSELPKLRKNLISDGLEELKKTKWSFYEKHRKQRIRGSRPGFTKAAIFFGIKLAIQTAAVLLISKFAVEKWEEWMEEEEEEEEPQKKGWFGGK